MKNKIIKKEGNDISVEKTKAISSLTSKLLNKKEWIEVLWEWADAYDLSEEYLPRTKDELLKLENLEILDMAILTKTDSSNPNFAEEIFNKNNQVKKPFVLIDEVFKLTNLKHLDIHHKDMKILPSNIARLENLTTLELSMNSIRTIPESITKLKHLTKLDLSFNSLKEVPEFICQMTQLKELTMDANPLKKLPDSLSNLSNLKHLSICCTCITVLPDTIVELKQLTYLNLDVECDKIVLTQEQKNWIEKLEENGCEVVYFEE
ncbi:MAG: leucine-rich repeat domain-containing protein [Sulfurimonas sp.]|nr:leucine-rich repeat domain-containing protein [Sulfurimonas sp.]